MLSMQGFARGNHPQRKASTLWECALWQAQSTSHGLGHYPAGRGLGSTQTQTPLPSEHTAVEKRVHTREGAAGMSRHSDGLLAARWHRQASCIGCLQRPPSLVSVPHSTPPSHLTPHPGGRPHRLLHRGELTSAPLGPSLSLNVSVIFSWSSAPTSEKEAIARDPGPTTGLGSGLRHLSLATPISSTLLVLPST